MPSGKVKWPPATKNKQPAPRPIIVKVGFFHYSIHWIEEANWTTPNGQSPDLQGAFDANEGTIRIRMAPRCHEQVLRETLWHEVLHACWWMMGLSESPIRNADDYANEEEHVMRISHATLQVMQDNPELMAYLGAALYKKKVDQ